MNLFNNKTVIYLTEHAVKYSYFSVILTNVIKLISFKMLSY